MHKKENIHIENEILRIGQDDYPIGKITTIRVVNMKKKDHLKRALTSIMVGGDGYFLIAWKDLWQNQNLQLEATFRGSDETGDNVVTLLRSDNPKDFSYYQALAEDIFEQMAQIQKSGSKRGTLQA